MPARVGAVTALVAALVAPVVARADVDHDADALLAAAAAAPHNGTNPQVALADAERARLRAALERAVEHGACARRRDAVSFLSGAAPQPAQHAFWAAQLHHVDLVVRFYAVANLGQLAVPADRDDVMRQLVTAPGLHNVLAVWLRSWPDRAIVPALVELLGDPDGTVAANAALSLGLLPFCPHLEPAPVGPAEHHETYWVQNRDPVGPYRRWWAASGARAFAAEQRAWTAAKAKLAVEPGLVGDGPCPP